MNRIEYMNLIIDRIKKGVEQFGSITQFAKHIGTSRQNVAGWLKGHIPRYETVAKFFPDIEIDQIQSIGINPNALTKDDYHALIRYAINKKVREVGTLNKVAEELDISRQCLYNWKDGKTDIPYYIADSYFGINDDLKKEYFMLDQNGES